MANTKIYQSKIRCFNYELFGTASDVDVWLRFSQVLKFRIIAKPLLKYRMSENSYSIRNRFANIMENDFFKVLKYYINKHSSLNKGYLEYYELKFQLLSIRNNLILKKPVKNIMIRKFSSKNMLTIIFKDRKKLKYISIF